MKITKPLDAILNTELKTKILRFLCRTGADWNGRQIAREIGVTPKSAHEALSALSEEGVLVMRNAGRTHIYSLNMGNFLVSSMLKPLFAREDKILDSIIAIIRRGIFSSPGKKAIASVVLFGSVNVHRDRPTSDIDIAVIVNNAGAKTAARRLFEEIDAKISKEFGNTLSSYINTKAEFRAKHKKGLAIIKNILRSHRIIYGKGLDRIS